MTQNILGVWDNMKTKPRNNQYRQKNRNLCQKHRKYIHISIIKNSKSKERDAHQDARKRTPNRQYQRRNFLQQKINKMGNT